jgi:hypothetical protein
MRVELDVLLPLTVEQFSSFSYNMNQSKVLLVSWWKSIMWSKIVSDTFKLQTNGYPHNHSDILTVFDSPVLLYQRLSDRNHLINKLQAGDTLRLERSILASKNDIFIPSFYKVHVLGNQRFMGEQDIVDIPVNSYRKLKHFTFKF